jgi:hypothetical protein
LSILGALSFASIVGFSASAHAVPVEIPYFGFLTFESGAVYNGDVALTVRLHSHPTAASTVWGPHTFLDLPVEDGRLAFLLGGPESAPLPSATLAQPELWLELQVGNTTLTPRQRILAVPYARVAEDAERLGGSAASAYARLTDLPSTAGLAPLSNPQFATGVRLGATPGDCTSALEGTIRYAAGKFEGCNGTQWIALDSQGIGVNILGQSPASAAQSCKQILDAGASLGNGPYWLVPISGVPAAQIYCDMVTDGGGWTLVAQRNQYGTYNASFAVTNNNVAGLGTLDVALDLGVAKQAHYDVSAFMNQTGATTLRVARRHPTSGLHTLDFAWASRNTNLVYNASPTQIFWYANRYWCTGDGPSCKNHGGLGNGWDISQTTSANDWLTYYGGGLMHGNGLGAQVNYNSSGVAWILMWAR